MARDRKTEPGRRTTSCAFMGRLDGLTTAVYPYDLSDEEGEAPVFSASSLSSTLPAVMGILRLAVVVFRPYVAVGLFGLAVIGYASAYCAAAGAVLLGYLCVFDKLFGVTVLGHPPPLQPGLYCKRSPRTDAVVSMVPALRHPHYKGTPWVIGGDVETLLPYLAFHLPTPTFIRRWLSVDADEPPRRKVRHESVHILNGAADFDDRKNGNIGDRKIPCGDKVDCHSEAIALDLALPKAGLDSSKPFYVMLHGLNGGSAEAYVLDFTKHALERGSGVCIMVTRGCMDTPVRGENIFHGARISDAKATVHALRQALPSETPLAMIGYSMGGIVAANYAACTGAESGLSCCVSMSGSLDVRPPLRSSVSYKHSLRVWQPILAKGLKEKFVVPNKRKIAARDIDLQIIERCKTVFDIDTNLVAPFNGYPSVDDYYIDMSAAAEGKISGLKTPLLAVSAVDDPITTPERSPMDEIAQVDDLYFLLTSKGGHVGWPMGWLPWQKKWLWMSSTALDFCEAIVATGDLWKQPIRQK